jgi:hypothetical protein
MTTPQKPLPKVAPFLERKTQPLRKNGVDMSGMLRIATMLVSLAGLTLSMLGAGALVLDVFDDGLTGNLEGILVKMIVLGIAFMFGWGVGLVSIRAFGNMFYPIIIKLYSWTILTAVSILYIKVIQKLYMQDYDTLHFWAYLVMLLGGLFVLICLHLLVEDHDLRPFAIPLLIISVLQLFAIVLRYIFDKNPNGFMLFGDFTIFIVMISISALMLMHIGILSPVREQISELFNQNLNHNGNGVE